MDPWPVVGRTELIASLQTTVADATRGGTLLLGNAGVGKTRLAAEVRRTAEGDGMTTRRVAGDRASAAVPLAGMAHLLPDDFISRSIRDQELDRAALFHLAREALTEMGGDDRMLVVADDAHLLDELSQSLLAALVRSRDISLIATVRGISVPAGPLDQLIRDHEIDEVTVPGLTVDQVKDLLHQVLDGPMDAFAVARFTGTSGGNPLYLRELVRASLDSEVLQVSNGTWTLMGGLSTSGRLSELVADRISDLTATELRTLEALALAGDISLGVAIAATDASALERLEELGLVTVETSGRRTVVGIGHPLYGEVLRSRIPALRAHNLRAALAEAVERFGSRRREDAIRVALWRLDSGAAPDAAVLLRGAQLARAAHELGTAERLARASWEVDDDPDAALVLIETVYGQGRHAEVESLCAELMETDLDDHQLVRVARLRSLNLFYSEGSTEAFRINQSTLTRLRPSPDRDILRAHHANLVAAGGLPELALDVTQDLDAVTDPRVQVEMRAARGMALAVVGRCEESLAELDAGLGVDADGQPVDQSPRLVMNKVVALSIHGDLADAADLAADAHEDQVRRGARQAGRWLGHWRSWVELLRGRADETIRLGTEFASWSRHVGQDPAERWSLALVALAHLQRGEVDTAAELLERSKSLETGPTGEGLFHPDIHRGQAGLAAAQGDTDTAAAILTDSADRSLNAGRAWMEAICRYDLVRLGRADTVAERLDHLRERSDSRMIDAMAAHATASTAGDADGLGRAVEHWTAIGAVPWAVEAATEWADLLRAAGRKREATGAAAQAELLAGRVGGVQSPTTQRTDAALSPLTPRERETALLAATGLTSREIAERLTVSVRTVDTHLQRVYTKLGITGRDALRTALERAPT